MLAVFLNSLFLEIAEFIQSLAIQVDFSKLLSSGVTNYRTKRRAPDVQHAQRGIQCAHLAKFKIESAVRFKLNFVGKLTSGHLSDVICCERCTDRRSAHWTSDAHIRCGISRTILSTGRVKYGMWNEAKV